MNVAVMLAYNPHNAGMYSVDLAAQKFFRQSGHKFRLYRALHGRYLPFQLNGSRLRCIDDFEPLKDADAIVFWGDFVHNPIYAVQDFHKREIVYSRGPQMVKDSLETWKKFYLLKGFDRGSRKVLSVSTNFQGAGRVLEELPPADVREIRDLLGDFDGIYPRDRISTKEVQALSDEDWRAEVRVGVDAAFLNVDPDHRREARERDFFTWGFFRSNLSTEDQHRIVHGISEATGLKPVHLSKWMKLNYFAWDRQYARMVAKIENSAFCISDTYHCLINAMTKKTPIIGISRDETEQTSTVSEFKKRELFEMFGLEDYFRTFGGSGPSEVDLASIVDLAKRIAKGDLTPDLFSTVLARTENYRTHLQKVLS